MVYGVYIRKPTQVNSKQKETVMRIFSFVITMIQPALIVGKLCGADYSWFVTFLPCILVSGFFALVWASVAISNLITRR